MIIGIGNDHVAVELKSALKEYIASLGHQVIDYGTNSNESINYPVVAKKVSEEIGREIEYGILLCGTGIGMSIAANKTQGIRAALCGDPYSAKMAKEHNNAQIICLGAKTTTVELAKIIVENWLNSEYQGGRHQIRLDLIREYEGE